MRRYLNSRQIGVATLYRMDYPAIPQQDFLETVFNYPTLAEAYKIAALDVWNRISG